MEAALLQNHFALGAMLFGIGLAGFLVRRNLIVIFLCAEMMLQGVSLSLIAWGRYHDTWDGQLLVVFVITVAACEAAVALVLILMLVQRAGNLDVMAWQKVSEPGTRPYVDREIPEESATVEIWPRLTPAGRRPEVAPEGEMFRPQV